MKRLMRMPRPCLLSAIIALFLTSMVLNVCLANSVSKDLNGDGRIDIKDVAIAASAFASYPGHERWNPNADINSDGRVDLEDIALIILGFGARQPIANFTANSENAPVGTQIEFDPSSSYDPDGTIILYEWDFDNDGVLDASTFFAETTSYTYMLPGIYTVTLQVTDNDGLIGTTTATHTVTPSKGNPETVPDIIIETILLVSIAFIVYIAAARIRRKQRSATI